LFAITPTRKKKIRLTCAFDDKSQQRKDGCGDIAMARRFVARR
jgi:hypothetical protein